MVVFDSCKVNVGRGSRGDLPGALKEFVSTDLVPLGVGAGSVGVGGFHRVPY